jgi:hypothetical protein
MKPTFINRRTLLRGLVGGAMASVGLPTLEAMLNSNGTALANGPPLPVRFITWFFGNGVVLNRWIPGGIRNPITGADYPLSPALAPFAGVRDYVSVASGFHNKCAQQITHHEGMTIFSGHTMADVGQGQGFFSNARGPTVDQVLAGQIGSLTTIPSVQMGVINQISMADYGTTMHNLSHKGHLAPLPPIKNPLQIFQSFASLFTPQNDPSRPVRISVADAVLEDFKALKMRLGKADIIRMDAHMDGLVELETKINALPPVCALPGQPTQTSDDVDGINAVNAALGDLLAFAFACDVTRVASFLFGGGASEAGFTEVGLTSQHSYSHGHSTNALDPSAPPYMESGEVENMQKGVVYQMEKLAYLVEKLKSTPDAAGGNLLDNTVIFASSDCSEGFSHNIHDQPMLLIGGGGGRLKHPGIHVRGTSDRNASDVVLTAVQAVVPTMTEVGSTDPMYFVNGGVDPAYSNNPLLELKA